MSGRAREPYDPKAYWTGLHAEESLRSVGQSGLPVELNHWLYRALEQNLLSFVRRHGLFDPSPRCVFEVGAGTGYWTAFSRRLGADRVDGCDLAEAVVTRLNRRYPDATYTVGDIAEPGVVPDDGRYDLVTVFNVFLHILDEERFAAATRHVAAAVSPGGHLLLVEPALLPADTAASSSLARPDMTSPDLCRCHPSTLGTFQRTRSRPKRDGIAGLSPRPGGRWPRDSRDRSRRAGS